MNTEADVDYEKLVEHYRSTAKRWEQGEQLLLCGELRVEDALREAADAIETLLEERGAAIKDVWKAADYPCRYCAEWKEGRCSRPGPKDCAGANWWKWRGPQKGENNDQTKL